jgi:hypothetical protein
MKSFARIGLSPARLAAVALAAAALSAVGCGGGMSGMPKAPPLVSHPGCSLWSGTISGNDPEAHIELEICPLEPGSREVMGRVQFTSERSGWSVREVEGAFTDDGLLELHEWQFDVYAPEFGWMFCLIDDYELRRSGPRKMVGSYESKACDDRAKVKLVRVK